MKKTLLTTLIICMSITALTVQSQTQQVGVGSVIFEDKDIKEIEHGFKIHQLSYTLVKLHLNIAGKNIETNKYEGETLTTIKKLEELTKTDIIEILDISTNKEYAFNKYLTESEQTLAQGDTIAAYMKQEMGILKSDMDSCLKQKEISDKEYFDAVERYDQNMMDISLKESISHETCIIEKRITYNAETEIARKLVFYLAGLQKKYDVLFAKQDILTKNFEIFRDNALPELNKIDQLLKQYKF